MRPIATISAFATLAVGLWQGCALDRGSGFSTLESATLEVSLDPGAARDLGNDTLLTDQGYQVTVKLARVRVEEVELQQVTGAAENQSFDPANPPPGYSLCHSGHCHRDDGALIEYEDIEIELAGGKQAFSPLVTLGFKDAISLLSGRSVAADSYDPSRELDRSNPRRVVVALSHLGLEGTVTGGLLDDENLELLVDLPLGTELDTTLDDLEIDRDGPERFDLHTQVLIDGTLFDGIDFSALGHDGSVLVDDPESDVALTLVASLAASETSSSVDEL